MKGKALLFNLKFSSVSLILHCLQLLSHFAVHSVVYHFLVMIFMERLRTIALLFTSKLLKVCSHFALNPRSHHCLTIHFYAKTNDYNIVVSKIVLKFVFHPVVNYLCK